MRLAPVVHRGPEPAGCTGRTRPLPSAHGGTSRVVVMRMGPLEPWTAVAASQSGVVTRRQLEIAGVTQGRIRGLLRSGRFVPLVHGVYATYTGPVSVMSPAWAAVLWAGAGSAVGGRTALWLWRVQDRPPPVVQVCLPISVRRRTVPPWIDARVRRPTTAVTARSGAARRVRPTARRAGQRAPPGRRPAPGHHCGTDHRRPRDPGAAQQACTRPGCGRRCQQWGAFRARTPIPPGRASARTPARSAEPGGGERWAGPLPGRGVSGVPLPGRAGSSGDPPR